MKGACKLLFNVFIVVKEPLSEKKYCIFALASFNLLHLCLAVAHPLALHPIAVVVPAVVLVRVVDLGWEAVAVGSGWVPHLLGAGDCVGLRGPRAPELGASPRRQRRAVPPVAALEYAGGAPEARLLLPLPLPTEQKQNEKGVKFTPEEKTDGTYAISLPT